MTQSPFLTNAIAVPLGAFTLVLALCMAPMAGCRTDVTPEVQTSPASPALPTESGDLSDAEQGTPTGPAIAFTPGTAETPVPTRTTPLTVTVTRGPRRPRPYYGMHFVSTSDLPTVKDLGAEVILMSFPHDGTPEGWLAYLDAAQAQKMRVIAWLWPEGWLWDGAAWQIDEQAELFVQTVAEHPALLAVYALHEPYWNGCWGCGYTTSEQQALYSAIKAIADVPIHSAVDSMSAWTSYAEKYDMDTAFTDGICDYCETWYHPFLEGGAYERTRLIAQLEADLAVARERAPDSKIVFSLQCFAQAGTYRMPTAEEMRDMASIVYARDVDGALWYPWTFGALYTDFLSNHPELYDTVREIYDDYVSPSRSETDDPGLPE
jgi:hypothetical protein